MGRYTLLRVESRSGLLGRLLDALPGVETVGTLDDVTADDSTAPTAVTKITATLGPPIRKYGLLGAGGALLAAGLSAVGLWWYRQRGDDATPDGDRGGDEGDEHGGTVLGSDPSAGDQQLGGRVDDRADVDWEPRDDTSDDSESTVPEPQTTTEPIDAAPLLGIVFLAITGAVVRWAKRGPTR